MTNGKRRLVQVYQLFNAQDVGSNMKTMSPIVREMCLSKQCTRKLLKNYFVGDRNEKENVNPSGSSHCCHNCDIKV